MVEFPSRLPTTAVLDVPVTRAGLGQVAEWVMECARRGLPARVAVAPVHNLVVARQDPEHLEALRSCQVVTADGQPVRWAMNLLREKGEPPLARRVYGPDLTLELCRAAAREGMPVYFFGSAPAVLEKLLARLGGGIPGLRVFGHAPGKIALPTAHPSSLGGERAGGREVYDPEDDLEKIRSSGAKILFVGLGCPKQERWIHLYAQRAGMPCLGVGAAFDFHAGTLAQAPAWMQARGLEWLFRLGREPARLWKRYLVGNSLFLGLLVLDFYKRKMK